MKKLICIVIASVILVTMNIGIFALENGESQNNKATFKLNLYEFNETDRTVLYNKPLDPTNIPIGTNVAVETVINNPNAFAPNGFMSLCYSLNYNSEYMTAKPTFLGAIEADGGVFQEGGAYTSETIDKNAILSVLTPKNNYSMQLHNISLDTNNKQLFMLLQNSVSRYNASKIINGSGDVKISTYYFKTLKSGNCTLEFESNINSKRIINWLHYQNNSSLNTSAGDYIDDENTTINPLSALNITIADLPPTINLNDGNARTDDPMYLGTHQTKYNNPNAIEYSNKDMFIYYGKEYIDPGIVVTDANGVAIENPQIAIKVTATYNLGNGNVTVNEVMETNDELTNFFKNNLKGQGEKFSLIKYVVNYKVGATEANRNVYVIHQRGDINRSNEILANDFVTYREHISRSLLIKGIDKNQVDEFDFDYFHRVVDINSDGQILPNDLGLITTHINRESLITQDYIVNTSVLAPTIPSTQELTKSAYRFDLYEINPVDRTILYNKPLQANNIPINTQFAAEIVLRNPNGINVNGLKMLSYCVEYDSEFITVFPTFKESSNSIGYSQFIDGTAYNLLNQQDLDLIMSSPIINQFYNWSVTSLATTDNSNCQMMVMLYNAIPVYRPNTIIIGAEDFKVGTLYFEAKKTGNFDLKLSEKSDARINWLEFKNTTSYEEIAGDYINDECSRINILSPKNITVVETNINQ